MCGIGGENLWKDRSRKEHAEDTQKECRHLTAREPANLALSESLPDCLTEMSSQSSFILGIPFLVLLLEGEHSFQL